MKAGCDQTTTMDSEGGVARYPSLLLLENVEHHESVQYLEVSCWEEDKDPGVLYLNGRRLERRTSSDCCVLSVRIVANAADRATAGVRTWADVGPLSIRHKHQHVTLHRLILVATLREGTFEIQQAINKKLETALERTLGLSLFLSITLCP